MALESLLNIEYDFKSAYCFARLHSRLKPHVEFYLRKEQELINEFSEKEDDGSVQFTADGRFVFASGKNPGEFAKLHSDLDNIEVDEGFTADSTKAPRTMSASTILALEGFIDFIPDE